MINTSKELLLLAVIVVAVALGPSWTTGAQTIAGPGKRQSTTDQTRRVLVIRNVTVIPATGPQPIANQTVVVRGEHIAAIGPAATTAIPAERACDQRRR
jgi:imidazolonepropionase-like amidohydrolase